MYVFTAYLQNNISLTQDLTIYSFNRYFNATVNSQNSKLTITSLL